MSSNRAFSIYAFLLITAVASLITTTVMAGVATLPSLLGFLEHVALGLMIRGAYKSLDGPYGVFEGVFGKATAGAEVMAGDFATSDEQLAA